MSAGKPSPLHILNLSHLIWERKLFQRPQQLATRFAQRGNQVAYMSIVSLRKYMEMDRNERLDTTTANLTAQNIPFMPFTGRLPAIMGRATNWVFYRKALPHLSQAPEGQRVLWIQHPAYIGFRYKIPHDILVYDVMDPFSAFSKTKSDPALIRDENRLLEYADVVFTGGRSLHSLIVDRRPDAHCFPSGIEFEHFAKAAKEGDVAPDIANLKKPILGYFGAVDERIDWELISYLCRERRHWSIVFLGPLIMMDKPPIDEPNFHWLGAKNYSKLPDYLRAFDVCLIPWKVNELTRFMSPTKTPEYLASGRPVVSTEIPDVIGDYSKEVLIAKDKEQYLEQCTKALLNGIGPSEKPPQSRTWDETAEQMEAILRDALAKKK